MNHWKICLTIALTVCFVGCSEPKYPVSGKVISDGKPLADINVIMVRSDGVIATGTTGADGTFSNVSTEGVEDGAFAGTYNVALTPAANQDESQIESPDAYAVPSGPPFPVRYLDASTSQISVTVEPDMAPVEIVVEAR